MTSLEAHIDAAHSRGLRQADRRCGAWPVVGDLSDFLSARDRAAREVDRPLQLMARWARRYQPDDRRLQLASARLSARRIHAEAIAHERQAILGLLLSPEGRA